MAACRLCHYFYWQTANYCVAGSYCRWGSRRSKRGTIRRLQGKRRGRGGSERERGERWRGRKKLTGKGVQQKETKEDRKRGSNIKRCREKLMERKKMQSEREDGGRE